MNSQSPLIADGNILEVVCLDFARVFDLANHRFFLAKRESFDVCEKAV